MKSKWTYEEGLKYGETVARRELEPEIKHLKREIQNLQKLVSRYRRKFPKLGLWAIRSGSKILTKKYLSRVAAENAAKIMFKPHQLALVQIIEV